MPKDRNHPTNPNTQHAEQYTDPSNLNNRIQLHNRFSTNPIGFHQWLFGEMKRYIPAVARILELGSGPATLWQKNRTDIPPNWEITLTDLSPGMLPEPANRRLDPWNQFRFLAADSQALPFPEKSFDVVMAHFMLYHVSDLSRAMSEVAWTLKAGGWFFAATVGQNHLREIENYVRNVLPDWRMSRWTRTFTLQNGADQIQPHLSVEKMVPYQDALIVTESEPLTAYINSSISMIERPTDRQWLEKIRVQISAELKKTGSIHISKESGVFICQKR